MPLLSVKSLKKMQGVVEGKISIVYARPEAKISPRVMISVVSQYVIGSTCHNESMLIGLFRQRQFADERKWLFVSADVRWAGTRDEPLRTSAWEAKIFQFTLVLFCI